MIKRTIHIVLACILCLGAVAQEKEIIRIYTDKTCYLAGEEMWIKVCIDSEAYPGNELSQVAYVEVCDTELMHATGKIALTNGTGWACIQLPQSMHSGSYQLTAYTRYMRNLPIERFATKRLAVINARISSEEDNFLVNDSVTFPSLAEEIPSLQTGSLSSKESIYASRSKVTLNWSEEMANAHELTLSVVRQDCRTYLPEATNNASHQVSQENQRWIAECEGHIVTGTINNSDAPELFATQLSCLGKEIQVFDGVYLPDGNYRFYTHNVYGQQDIVLSTDEGTPYRMEPVSPFAEILPVETPALYAWFDEQELTRRSIALQLTQELPEVELEPEISHLLFNKLPDHSYNFDEYVRFNTVREAFIEFVIGVNVDRIDGKRIIRMLRENISRYGRFKSLVLIDGVPFDDHDAVLQFDARQIHYLHQYRGRYTMGNRVYEGVLSMITHRGEMTSMRIGHNMHMLEYEFPQKQPTFHAPEYHTAEQVASRMPDFRHTLYWQPFFKRGTTEVSFFTSDMKGTYKATLQGIADDGSLLQESCTFVVK